MTAPAETFIRSKGPRRPRRRVDGIVLLDKPPGLTSNRALQRAREALSAAKAGHAGTLDPMATGMLPLCFGQATKACGLILGARKVYRVRLRLGVATDSGDSTGKVVARAEVPLLDAAIVAGVLADFVGVGLQTPPMLSALKHQGERLYELARRGETVPRPERRIELHRVELIGIERDEIEFDVECSKGTYVRVLGEDMASRLGTVGHLAGLRRLWVAPFESASMVSLEEITAWQAAGDAAGRSPGWLLPVDRALADLERVDLNATDSSAIRHGRDVATIAELTPGVVVRGYDETGALLGLLRAESDRRLHVVRLLVDTPE